MADTTDKTDDNDDFYDDPATMGEDMTRKILEHDNELELNDELSQTPLVPERTAYDLEHRGTLDEVEEAIHEPGGEDHDVPEGGYESSNDQGADMDPTDSKDNTRG
jgi:hypothetical protein